MAVSKVLITAGDSSIGTAITARLRLLGHEVYSVPLADFHYSMEDEMFIRVLTGVNVKKALEVLGSIDWVVNNYGTNRLSKIGEASQADEEMFLFNSMAAYWVIDHLVRLEQTCNVVNITSQTYRVPQRYTALYSASKAALTMMTKVMSRELAPSGWRINALAPGRVINTEMDDKTMDQVLELRGWDRDYAESYARSLVPCGRFLVPEEVADATIKLLEGPDYMNGSIVDLMGGV